MVETLELATNIVDKLNALGQSVGTTESCTGGLVASSIVDVAGASGCFNEGYITYSNEAKHKLLGVSNEILSSFGAVSEECAKAMAEGARINTNSDYGVATTGIAGPEGGTKDKPVGLVYIACATCDDAIVEKHIFTGDRLSVRCQAATRALELLNSCIREN